MGRAMTADILFDNVLTSVRALLRRHAPYTRHALDLLLGDLEANLRRDLDELDEQHEREVRLEVQWAREDLARESQAKAAKSARTNPKSRKAAA
jgi:hypothetical protein